MKNRDLRDKYLEEEILHLDLQNLKAYLPQSEEILSYDNLTTVNGWWYAKGKRYLLQHQGQSFISYNPYGVTINRSRDLKGSENKNKPKKKNTETHIDQRKL